MLLVTCGSMMFLLSAGPETTTSRTLEPITWSGFSTKNNTKLFDRVRGLVLLFLFVLSTFFMRWCVWAAAAPGPACIAHPPNVLSRESFSLVLLDDTGNRHIVTNWQLKGCSDYSTEYPNARMWTVPAGVNCPQFQLIFDNVTYLDEPSDAVISIELVKADRYGQHYMAIYDADGSLTRRGVRMVDVPFAASVGRGRLMSYLW